MGKKLDRLFGRTFKTSKFKTLVNLAISRLAILKNNRRVRCSQARSDVLQLLNLGHHEQALLRVEHVIREQNMLDVFVIIEGYCRLLIERVGLIEQNKECPYELEEAISSLLFAASRCGQFPELQEIHRVLTSRFGKEFAAGAVELRSNCGVIQKLSTRQPSLESRLKELREIASVSGIVLHLEDTSSEIRNVKEELTQENQTDANLSADLENVRPRDDIVALPDEIDLEEQFSGSVKAKYNDVTDAAQAAFESAAYAAAAARVAVELSQSQYRGKGPGDQSSPSSPHGRTQVDVGSLKFSPVTAGNAASRNGNKSTDRLDYEKIHPLNNYSSESEDEKPAQKDESNCQEFKESKKKAEPERSPSASSLGSSRDLFKDNNMSLNRPRQAELPGKEIVFHKSNDNRYRNGQDRIPSSRHHYLEPNNKSNFLGPDKESGFLMNEFSKPRLYNTVTDEVPSAGIEHHRPFQRVSPTEVRSRLDNLVSAEQVNMQHSNVERKPVSVRTRRVHRH